MSCLLWTVFLPSLGSQRYVLNEYSDFNCEPHSIVIPTTENAAFASLGTQNPLVVFSSNMFAIMGLRSLYTVLSKAAADLKYLEPAVAIVLGFIGSKMIAEYVGYTIPTQLALLVVGGVLSGGVALSVLDKQEEVETEQST